VFLFQYELSFQSHMGIWFVTCLPAAAPDEAFPVFLLKEPPEITDPGPTNSKEGLYFLSKHIGYIFLFIPATPYQKTCPVAACTGKPEAHIPVPGNRPCGRV